MEQEISFCPTTGTNIMRCPTDVVSLWFKSLSDSSTLTSTDLNGGNRRPRQLPWRHQQHVFVFVHGD